MLDEFRRSLMRELLARDPELLRQEREFLLGQDISKKEWNKHNIEFLENHKYFTTYGQEQLPVLVAGLGHYESWATLIPAVYGVSATEFEAGWQAYLATQYGVSLETLLHQ